MIFKGCVLTSLTISADIGEESGKVNVRNFQIRKCA